MHFCQYGGDARDTCGTSRSHGKTFWVKTRFSFLPASQLLQSKTNDIKVTQSKINVVLMQICATNYNLSTCLRVPTRSQPNETVFRFEL